MKKKVPDELPATKGDLKKLEARFDGLEGRFDGLETKFEFQGERINSLEKKLEEKFNVMMNHIDGLAKLIKDLREEFSLQVLTRAFSG